MPDNSISRRTLLDAAVRIAALPSGVAFFSAWMSAAQQHEHSAVSSAPPDAFDLSKYEAQFFDRADFDALRSFTEILIPTDETPGAREAHCAHFIDFLLHSMDTETGETQREWRAAMTVLKSAGFHSASPEKQLAMVTEMARPEHDPTAHHPAFAAYRLIKRENTFAFYTARTGSIEALDYRGNSVNLEFPACAHPEHQTV